MDQGQVHPLPAYRLPPVPACLLKAMLPALALSQPAGDSQQAWVPGQQGWVLRHASARALWNLEHLEQAALTRCQIELVSVVSAGAPVVGACQYMSADPACLGGPELPVPGLAVLQLPAREAGLQTAQLLGQPASWPSGAVLWPAGGQAEAAAAAASPASRQGQIAGLLLAGTG